MAAPATPKRPPKEDTSKKSRSRKVAQESDDNEDDDDDESLNGTATKRQNEDVAAQKKARATEKSHDELISEAEAELAKLDPQTEPRRWLIGKPPEQGGKEDEYAVYVQDTMPWMARGKFFALVARTFADAIKASGGSVGASMGDLFGDEEGGSLVERGRRLSQRDFGDATQFMSLAFELIAYSPDFLVKCYLLWLDVPRRDRGWARERFNEPWKPEEGLYGLKDEWNKEIIQTFIDQNFEGIRDFFVEELPAIGKRAALHERSKDRTKKDHKPESDL